MGKITIYPGGSTASYPADSPHARSKRGQVRGWTPGAARRLLAFLWSVSVEDLTGRGFAVTLTMGGRPQTSTDWAVARERLLRWLRQDVGAARWQWLTEWTANGRPHLHLCVFDQEEGGTLQDWEIALRWIEICRDVEWPASWGAQHVEELHNTTGWLKYVAKHSARGVAHYQRETPPEGWDVTGRLWGRGGIWPTVEPLTARLTAPQTKLFVDAFRVWQAERMIDEGVEAATVTAYLDGGDTPKTGAFPRGVSGWIPDTEAVNLLTAVQKVTGY